MNRPDGHGPGHGSKPKQPATNTPPPDGVPPESKHAPNGVIQAGLRSLDHCTCCPGI